MLEKTIECEITYRRDQIEMEMVREESENHEVGYVGIFPVYNLVGWLCCAVKWKESDVLKA